MPNLRLRSGPTTTTTLVLRPAITISGVTRDSAGAVLAGCVMHLFRTSDDLIRDRSITSLGVGQYGVTPYDTSAHYVVAIKSLTTDLTTIKTDTTGYTTDQTVVEGITVNTLVGAVDG